MDQTQPETASNTELQIHAPHVNTSDLTVNAKSTNIAMQPIHGMVHAPVVQLDTIFIIPDNVSSKLFARVDSIL
jgi:hypothetical protein